MTGSSSRRFLGCTLVGCAIAALSSGRALGAKPNLATTAAQAEDAAGPATSVAPIGAASQPVPQSGFDFGSYGRVGVGSDLDGHEGYATNVVSHGSRLEEPPYIEFDFYYHHLVDGDPHRQWLLVLTPAFMNSELFHYSGSLNQNFVLRNAYIETDNVGLDGLSLWVGSRMYRGDDAYLFDYWPLDNLNTVGGGAEYQAGRNFFALQTGLNRLDSEYQYEQIGVAPAGLGPPGEATVLDRPRSVSSIKLTHFFGSVPGAKLSFYGELHLLPGGNQIDPTTLAPQGLPSDYGWVAGLQLGGWLRESVFTNLWLRSAGGLAAYGDLAVPSDIDPTRRVSGAREYVAAFSSNWESPHVGVMLSGYVRRFDDPGPGPYNPNSYTERILATRPYFYWSKWAETAFEFSYQSRVADGLDYATGRHLVPRVFRASILPIVSPLGAGTYTRPHIYLVYTVSVLNRDAEDFLFLPQDYRAGNSVDQYLGIGAEWWFNSSYR